MDVTDSPITVNTEDEEKTAISYSNSSQGNTDYVEEKETKKRRIGQWYIDKTLGKGGYSWVKMGIDVKTNKRYALKFMERRKDESGKLRKSQIKQVETEISVLRSIGKNAQIIKLIAYNLNQRYPDKNGNDRDVILLVLEYCPGGELFDLLYYTSHLEAILARTYFHQLCTGMSYLHRHGIIHRDIKPQNLLLDNAYNLKITDFGLSYICKSSKSSGGNDISNVRLLNPRVGTRGYQAPEIVNMNNILQKGGDLASTGLYYTHQCDIFSMGVVLFILMTGYPPFKCADTSDKWYGHIATGNYQSFWKLHRKCGLKKYETDLITKMLFYDMNKRITMKKIENHIWYKQEILTNHILTQIIAIRHEKTQKLMKTDSSKQAILQYSERITRRPILEKYKNRILSSGKTLNAQPPILNERPNVMHCIYTSVDAYEVLQEIKKVIEENMKGVLCNTSYNEIFEDEDDGKEEEADIDIDNFCLTATVAYLKDVDLEETKINVQLYYDNIKQCNLVYFNIIDDNTDKFEEIDKWINLKNIFLTKAAHVLTGLPDNYKQQKGVEVNKDIEELYKKCFPDRLNKKE